MKKTLSAGLLCAVLALLSSPLAPAQQSAAPPSGLAGHWTAKVDFWGTPLYFQMELKRDGPILKGTFGGDTLTGTASGSSLHDGTEVHFLAKDDQGGTEQCDAILKDGVMTGNLIFTDPADPAHPETHTFTASPVRERAAHSPQRHEFTPTKFYRQFSALNEPVLRVSPGDTIHTTTVDAGGTDEHGVKRVLGGNPQTGPFYIEGAEPGDTLVVHLDKLRLNRDYAISDDDLVPRAVDTEWSVKMKDAGKTIKWHLDTARGVATMDKPTDHLKNYSVPLRPMLGCIATAPSPAAAAPGTGDSGGFGGNMDFNDVIEGATVYLPVRTPGAMLYLGDGHAAQGDGELNGNALETSMDVEFTVDVISGKRIPGPRVESPSQIMAVGLDGSIDDAFRDTTVNMANWLTDKYGLTPTEVAEVLGTSAEYHVNEVADRNAGVVLKIDKRRLETLPPAAK
ncbi:MAG: acetamidase/formamidase family protein [Candidatus Acidiferrum sp.]